MFCRDLCYVPRSHSVKSPPSQVILSSVPRNGVIRQGTHMSKLVICPAPPLSCSIPIICVLVGLLHLTRLECGGAAGLRLSSKGITNQVGDLAQNRTYERRATFLSWRAGAQVGSLAGVSLHREHC